MAGRERLTARAALSRLPRWTIVLGIVLVLAELAGIAASRAKGNSALMSRPGGTRTVTVVLEIDGELAYLLQSPPIACNGHGGPCDPSVYVSTGTVTYTTPTGSATYHYTALPSTTKIQVPVGGAVTLNASSDVDVVDCSILLNGKVLNRTWYSKDTAHTTCRATIGSGPSHGLAERP